MPRRYRRRMSRRPLKTVKYSNETTNMTGTLNMAANENNKIAQISASLISSVKSQGMRKAKNFTLKFIYSGTVPLIYVLAYVPEGQHPSTITLGLPDQVASLYEPNQNVIMSGYICPGANQAQVARTRLARNLNSGDSIQLIIANCTSTAIQNQTLGVCLNYAITY